MGKPQTDSLKALDSLPAAHHVSSGNVTLLGVGAAFCLPFKLGCSFLLYIHDTESVIPEDQVKTTDPTQATSVK